MMEKLARQAVSLPQSARFLFAGGFAAGVNWLVRFPLSEVMPFLPAVVLAAIIGMLVGFVTYRAFVFPGSDRPIAVQARDFLAVNLGTMVVVTIAAMGLKSLLVMSLDIAMAEAVAHALGIAIGAVLNYFGHNVITFRSRAPTRDTDNA